MTPAARRRLERIETALTPKQAVLAWLKHAQSFSTYEAYILKVAEQPNTLAPRMLVYERLSASVKRAMQGRDRDSVSRALDQATREGDFLTLVVLGVNQEVMDQTRFFSLESRGLAFQLIRLLEHRRADDARAQVEEALNALAYPHDPATAAAIVAYLRDRVETWAWLERQTGQVLDPWTNWVTEWVTAHLQAQGAREIPIALYPARMMAHRPGAARRVLDATHETLMEVFGSADACADFIAGTDYAYGLADVPNARVEALRDKIIAAMKALVRSGAVQAGVEAFMPTIPIRSLDYPPLVEGVWMDRFLVELAEWGGRLERAGYRLRDSEDGHPLAWKRIVRPGTEDEEAGCAEVGVVREKVRAACDRFKGRTCEREGRRYWHIDDYRRWKGRRAEIACVEEGLQAASFNDWVASQSGQALLAGIPVGTIDYPGLTAEHVMACRTAADAKRQQGQRAQVMAGLEPQGVAAQACWADVGAELRDHAAGILTMQRAVQAIEQHYFDRHSILFTEVGRALEGYACQLEQLVEVYNNVVCVDPLLRRGCQGSADDEGGDAPVANAEVRLDDLRQAIHSAAAEKAAWLVDHARAETLQDLVGDRAAGLRVLLPYVTGPAEAPEPSESKPATEF